MNCNKCDQKIEYDEGEGNQEDGYVCFECKEETLSEVHEIKISQIIKMFKIPLPTTGKVNLKIIVDHDVTVQQNIISGTFNCVAEVKRK